jgi:hypothetical protein
MLEPETPSAAAHGNASHDMRNKDEELDDLFTSDDEGKESLEDLFESDDSGKSKAISEK